MPDFGAVLFSTPAMADVFSGTNQVRAMLTFEAALARAEARAGIIPSEAADAITAACQVERFDVATLQRAAATAGTLAIPLVRVLSTHVGDDAGRYVHWGATSQDAIDTATILQVRDGLALLLSDLFDLADACATLAERHRHDPMAARTLLQQALPMTFGLKAARWLALTCRQIEALRALRRQVLVVQLGGAAGTLASLGADGPRVADLLAEELELTAPDLPWHAERDRMAALGAALGILAGSLGKIAGDVLLLGQSEIGEATEAAAPGKGGSSTLPQKRNPVDATMALAGARLALGQAPTLLGALLQEHERAVGGWQLEWMALPDLFRTTASVVERVYAVVARLRVEPARMRANLELSNGLIMAESLTMALAPALGRQPAHDLVRAASDRALAEGRHLRDVALADPKIGAVASPETIARVLDPASYLGSTDMLIERALAGYRQMQAAGIEDEPPRPITGAG
ncbi:MAG: 3-carboxy-cis,cis-muconate cycloisomerase [Chloroflexi bacterium]|nr:3-carboxy-cis,cis-muconate cycloisomerase [Chloroflexota bacterium]